MTFRVIAGLDPAIHPLKRIFMMDARVKPAHDEESCCSYPRINSPPMISFLISDVPAPISKSFVAR